MMQREQIVDEEKAEAIISYEIQYDNINRDIYALHFFADRVLATCNETMDDNFYDNGYTHWEAILPKDLVTKCLEEFKKNGESDIEILTSVKKSFHNRWVYYTEEGEEKYDYPVRIKLKKDDKDKTELKINFQKNMDFYF